MLFIKPSHIAGILVTLFALQGCQSVDDELVNVKEETVIPKRILSPMEIIHESPNQYLINTRVVAPITTQQFSNAQELVRNKDWVNANKKLLELTVAAPTLSGPWLLLGDVAKSQGETAHAIAHYQQAIYVNEHNYFARNRLAALLREQGDFAGARAQYQHAILSWPAYTNARLNLGVLLDLYIGESENALEQYKIAAALNTLNNQVDNRSLKGWIADLSRRVTAAKKTVNKLEDNNDDN